MRCNDMREASSSLGIKVKAERDDARGFGRATNCRAAGGARLFLFFYISLYRPGRRKKDVNKSRVRDGIYVCTITCILLRVRKKKINKNEKQKGGRREWEENATAVTNDTAKVASAPSLEMRLLI